jgi:hypothetical protein
MARGICSFAHKVVNLKMFMLWYIDARHNTTTIYMVYVECGMRPNYNYNRIIDEVSFGLSDKSMRRAGCTPSKF